MRIKEVCIIISFKTTTQAMAFENICENDIEGRLIPLPPIIHAGCGLAWKSKLKEKRKLLDIIQEKQLSFDEIHEIEV